MRTTIEMKPQHRAELLSSLLGVAPRGSRTLSPRPSRPISKPRAIARCSASGQCFQGKLSTRRRSRCGRPPRISGRAGDDGGRHRCADRFPGRPSSRGCADRPRARSGATRNDGDHPVRAPGRREDVLAAASGRRAACGDAVPAARRAECRCGGGDWRTLERSGTAIGMADSLIAGIVVAGGGVLLTRNRRHFERVQGLALGGLSQPEGNSIRRPRDRPPPRRGPRSACPGLGAR